MLIPVCYAYKSIIMTHLDTRSTMTKPLTIRTDDATLQQLDELAHQQHRSRNHLINQAIKAYTHQTTSATKLPASNIPVAQRLEDLGGDVWPKESSDDFLEHLKNERHASLMDDSERDAY